ncbi:MAG TPA: dipeptidase, partial [Gammaproteobacteria bacterium]|nr:dipeptidase [Gammaproteobacteria bacterium]
IHEAVLTLDTHVDIPLDFATTNVDPLAADLQVNLQKMADGRLDAAFFIVYVSQTERTDANYLQAQADARTKFAAIHRMAEDLYPDRIQIAYSADDVARISATGKLVAAIGIENGYVIGKDVRLLDDYYALGARYLTLVHDGDNDVAHSARPKPELGDAADESAGVTELGAQVIARLNRLGMMVDVSHASKQSALDAMRLSEAPVIASHSGVSGVTEHRRNMDDETLLALKQSGGVIQVVAYNDYLKVQPEAQRAAVRALTERLGVPITLGVDAMSAAQRSQYELGMADINRRWPRAEVGDLVDHIDYAVRLIGIDHVGISSDFGGGGGVVGWSDARETPNVTRELRSRGYSEADVGKLWSGNLLRVWRDVERVAADLASKD